MLLISWTDIRILDFVDLLIVLVLIWQIYKLLKGTIAFNIFIGVMILYGAWYVVQYLEMKLLTFLLGPFIGFGVLILIIIFQPEVRQFLLMLGNNTLKNRFDFVENLWKNHSVNNSLASQRWVEELLIAMTYFKSTRTGALIVLSQNASVPIWNNSGQIVEARLSSQMLKTIFHKESPTHDGAMIIVNGQIYAVSVILPVTEDTNLPYNLGLRHRAAVGVSEKTNAVAFVVSEETGDWSMAEAGRLHPITQQSELKKLLSQKINKN